MKIPLKITREKIDYTYLFRLLVDRDLKERYAGSWLGLSWSIVQPAALFFTYLLVFSVILKVKPGSNYDGISFPVWMLSGLVPWLFVAEVMTRSPKVVVDHTRIVTKNAFPNVLLPWVTVVSALVNHIFSLLLLTLVLPYFGVTVSASLLWLPAWTLGLVLFGAGLAMLASAIGVYFQDLGQVAPILVMVWNFGTPIVYPEKMVPPQFAWLLKVNPAALLVRGYRGAILGRQDFSLEDLGVFLLWGLGFYLVGSLVFRRLRPGFADVL